MTQRWMTHGALLAAVISVWTTSAWAAGTGHYYIPASAMQCVSGSGCVKTTYLAACAGGAAYPVIELPDDGDSNARVEFWFPESHESTCSGGCKFNVMVHYANKDTGSQEISLDVGMAFQMEGTSGWGVLVGNEGSEITATNTYSGACHHRRLSVLNIVSYSQVDASACTYNDCKNQPGMIWINHAADPGTTEVLITGIDVYWTTP